MNTAVEIQPGAKTSTATAQNRAPDIFATLVISPIAASAAERLSTRLAELQPLVFRVQEALCGADLHGIKLIQVWPNGDKGLPAVGLLGECDMAAGDALHKTMGGFIAELQSGHLAYTTDRHNKVVNVRPWSGYTGPIG